MTVFAVELRRALARRLVRVLVLLALIGVVVIAVGALVAARSENAEPFTVDDIWSGVDDTGDANILLQTSTIFVLMALLGGASFVGAEYRSGTITTLLTWEPRRARVIAGKLLAAGIVAGVVYAVLQSVLALALVPALAAGDATDGLDGEFLRRMGGLLLRGGLLTGGCAVLGASIAAIGRNTTAALGVALGYLIVVEQILRGLRPGWADWFLVENLAVTLTGDSTGFEEVTKSVPAAAVLLAAYLAVLALGAGVVFVRRDVT